MRRSIICFIIIASLVLCSTSIAFANPLDPWTSVQADRVTNGVISIDNTLSNVYTGLSALYNYLKNNGDGVVEGLLVLANRVSNIINTLDYYLPLQNSVLQNLYSFFVPPSGDTRDIWDLLSQISANTTATSTALNTTNSELLTIDSHVDGVESSLTSIGSRLDTVNYNLTQIYDSLYYDSFVDINTFFDYFFDHSSTDVSSSKIPQYLNNYPFDNDYSISGQMSYFNLIVPTSFFDSNNSISVYFPYNTLGSPLVNYNLSMRYYVSNDLETWSRTNSINQIFTGNIYDDYILCSTTLSDLSVLNYNYVLLLFSSGSGSNLANNDFLNCTPYVKVSSLQKVNYLQSILEELQNNNNDEIFNDIKNILIDIDNNSDFIQNNNDLQINVDIDAADGVVITGVINKLKSLFSTGVGLSQFLLSLNEFDNLLWFTSLETYQQVNYNPNVSGNGYQDLYD